MVFSDNSKDSVHRGSFHPTTQTPPALQLDLFVDSTRAIGLTEAVHIIREIKALWSLLPTQTRRTREQQAFQQFSTPAPHAVASAWAAGLRVGDVVLEPSAGTGALLVWALAANVCSFVNELAAHRVGLLRILFCAAGENPA